MLYSICCKLLIITPDGLGQATLAILRNNVDIGSSLNQIDANPLRNIVILNTGSDYEWCKPVGIHFIKLILGLNKHVYDGFKTPLSGKMEGILFLLSALMVNVDASLSKDPHRSTLMIDASQLKSIVAHGSIEDIYVDFGILQNQLKNLSIANDGSQQEGFYKHSPLHFNVK